MYKLRKILPRSRSDGGPPPAPLGLTPGQAQARIEEAFGGRRRDFLWVVPLIALVWTCAATYYFLMPPRHVSKWSMIMPTATSGASVQLDTIGQSSTIPGQPFGNITISPKVIYKEIAASDQVRQDAADAMGMSADEFGRPRVRLIDETSLLLFEITGSTGEQSRDKARALTTAFQRRLDVLRRDEFERRAGIVRNNLKLYQANLESARQRILEFQQRTGVLSANQFTEAISSAELVRRKLAELHGNLGRASREQATLIARVGLSEREAAAALKLGSDSTFVMLVAKLAEFNANNRDIDFRLGPSHPSRLTAEARRDAIKAELRAVAKRLDIDADMDIERLATTIVDSRQADLLRAIVAGEARLKGDRDEVATLEKKLVELTATAKELGGHAAQLEHLNKDHLVAQAVYTTAVARLDTDRSDVYSSYPMVQVLAAPETPGERSQPRMMYAIAAGVAGSSLVLFAWGVAWLRTRLSHRRLKRS